MFSRCDVQPAGHVATQMTTLIRAVRQVIMHYCYCTISTHVDTTNETAPKHTAVCIPRYMFFDGLNSNEMRIPASL